MTIAFLLILQLLPIISLSQRDYRYFFFPASLPHLSVLIYQNLIKSGKFIAEHITINGLSINYTHIIKQMSKLATSLWLISLYLFVLTRSANLALPSSFSVPVVYTVQAGYSVTYSSLYVNPDCWMFNLNHPFSAWSAYVNDSSQWVQVSSIKPEVWVGVITQGRPNFDQWVSQFRVSYSLDGVSWTYVDNAKLFAGNSNRNTQVRNFFSKAISARAIRIHPTKWVNFVSMRFDALIIDA